jgi:hypothetical protein
MTGGDAGAGDSGTNYNTPAKCSSGKTWTGGNGSQMRPGENCLACHNNFSIAGTVFPTAHEPNDCDGANVSGMSVVITDANNKVTTLAVNAQGNFYSTTSIATPFHAKVVSGTKERDMVASQTTGACDSSHTETGTNSAPGRIMAP